MVKVYHGGRPLLFVRKENNKVKKEFYIDSFDNINFRTTFYDNDDLSFGDVHINSLAVPDRGIRLHVSIKRKSFLNAILAMANNKNSIFEAVLYADTSLSDIGYDIRITLRRSEDMMINLMYIFKVKVDSGETIETMFSMRPYMPFDPIDFLTEYEEEL